MTQRIKRCGPWTVALVAGALSLWGCVDEEIVYRDKPFYEDPPAQAAGFLGYSDTTAKKTTCGNCHAGQQGAWAVSAHSDALASLVGSGHAQETCYACHTVSEKGSAATGTVGYMATKSGRYEDVQCENCHNGGLAHVQNPSATQPLASIAVDTSLADGCGECHQGSHHPYVEEWRGSEHGRITASLAAAFPTDEEEYESCGYCHEGKKALEVQFNVKSEYVEKDQHKFFGITCAVCHDPHGSAETGQLRAPIESRIESENLCMKCHHKRAVPDESSQRGPHSPQGPLVLGEAGWRPPNFVYSDLAMETTHGSDRNPRLCAGCHLAKFEVDASTVATGHVFESIPCIDPATGKPKNGAGNACDVTARSFRTCTGAGCHGSESAARSAMIATEARLTTLTNELKRLIALAPRDSASNDGKITVWEGARFNGGMMSGDLSRGVHNPFLMEALLLASIDAVKTTYGVK